MTPQGDFHDPLAGWYIQPSADEAREDGEWMAPSEAQRRLVFRLAVVVVWVVALTLAATIYAWFASHPVM